jgi:uncharacterized protein YecE (DUF72 family)
MNPRLRIGTCSWRYPSWTGLVYSAPGGIDYLAEYAARYSTVEVDRWFWSLYTGHAPRLPDRADVAGYRAAVPENFLFTVKAPNSLTLTHYHGKSAPAQPNPHFLSADLAREFLASLSPLGNTLGPVMFQFEYLNKQKMPGPTEWISSMTRFRKELPAHAQYAIEIRNANYLTADYFAFLRDQNLIPVLLQGYWMPPVTDLWTRLREPLSKFPKVILRLHGPDREGIEEETHKQWDAIVQPRDAELDAIASMVDAFLEVGMHVVINVNNHFEGSAPITIERLEKRIQQ